MKIAFCIRKNYLTAFGGDSVQAMQTKKNIEASYDVAISIVTDPAALNRDFSIAHIFNLATVDETRAFLDQAKKLELKIAVSTVFWDYSFMGTKDIGHYIGYRVHNPFAIPAIRKVNTFLSLLINKPRVIAAPFKKFIREATATADVLLPNSIEEIYQLADFVGIDRQAITQKTTVVYNAAASRETEATTDAFETYQLPKGYVLQVGRIEYIKNQLGLLKALYDDRETPIVFVGRVNEPAYYQALKKAADRRGNVYFVNEVKHEDIGSFFKNAKLHVLPSLRESPGLVNLEALLEGCKIVVSNSRYLPFDTYFKGIGTAVDPLSPRSIREGIDEELATSRNMAEIKEYIAQKFSWSMAAAQTVEGYEKILGKKIATKQ